MQIIYKPIGVIHSPFTSLENMPNQPTSSLSASGTVTIFPEFVPGLQNLAGFSHIYLLCHLHQVRQPKLTVIPSRGIQPRGVFATRSPNRPNPIGLSLVELLRIEGDTLHVDHLDMLDGTPVLDIKPYFPRLEDPQDVRLGWLDEVEGR